MSHMARKLPIKYSGAIYHVMNRGDRREAIFVAGPEPLIFENTIPVAPLDAGPSSHPFAPSFFANLVCFWRFLLL